MFTIKQYMNFSQLPIHIVQVSGEIEKVLRLSYAMLLRESDDIV